LRLARAISDDIRRGRLRPGQVLPSSRGFATLLGVHRNTVLAAYRELEAEGWLVTRPASGTFVSAALPEMPAQTERRGRRQIGFDVPPVTPTMDPLPPLKRGSILLLGGTPDLRELPRAALARAYRRATRSTPLFSYGDARGLPRLRAGLAAMLSSTRAVAATDDNILVTRGSQMALDLVARALIRPGDAVAVEALGYQPAWAALTAAGATLVPIPVDAGGLDVDRLAALCKRRRIRAVYLTPHHQYPTTVSLKADRRLRLLDLAATERIALLEDDYDNEFHYDGRPLLPLASADPAGVVVYLGTLSKILAPGLRLGFVAAPPELIARLTDVRRHVDRQGDHLVEAAVADLLDDGEVQRHAHRMRRLYAARRDTFAELLRRHLGGVLSFTVPSGGIAFWAAADPALDVDAWLDRSMAAGVVFQTARRFRFDGTAAPFVRLGFASPNERELAEAVRRLVSALPRRGTR
jgi:GntR family transcriptional regulator/MocR family aminotransferase